MTPSPVSISTPFPCSSTTVLYLQQAWNQRRQQRAHNVLVFGSFNDLDLHLDSSKVEWELVRLNEWIQYADTLLCWDGTC